jgi:putative ABC transport system permease protein
MKSVHSFLLWKALFFRVLETQKRLFIFAGVTVSLGVALALGIRLGTESATQTLRSTLPLPQDKNWSEPIQAKGSQALLFIREHALRYDLKPRIFSVLEAQAVRTHFFGERTASLQLIVPWVGEHSSPTTDQCQDEFATLKRIQIGGMIFPVALKQLDPSQSKAALNCNIALFDETAIAKDDALQRHFSNQIKNAPVKVFFNIDTPEKKTRFQELLQMATQIPGIELDADDKRIQRLQDVTRSFRVNLQLMGFIALFIGFAMVHHIFSMLIARQSKTLATMSALGISQNRQTAVLLSLAAALGFFSSALGIFLGLVAGYALSWVTSSTVQGLYDSLVDASQFQWQTQELFYGFFLGFTACFLGALHPISKIRKLPVAHVMRDGSFESHESGLSIRQALSLTLVISLLCAGLLRWPVLWNRIPITALAACLCLLIISALFSQIFVHSLYHVSRLRPNSKFHWPKDLRIYLPPQASVVVQVLTLTFTLTFGVKGMAESFRQTVADWAQTVLRADVWIRSIGVGSTLPEPLLEKLKAGSPSEILAVDTLSVTAAELLLPDKKNYKPVIFANARMSEQAKISPLRLLLPEKTNKAEQSSIAQQIATNAQTCKGTFESPCLAYISEPLSVHFNLKNTVGTILCPVIQSHRICFRTVGIYQDFGSDQGVILTDVGVFYRLTGETLRPSFANIYFSSEEHRKYPQQTSIVSDVQKYIQDSDGAVGIETLKELQGRILETFDKTFRVTDALYLLCGVIAIIATLSSLNMQILLRQRDWNIQWALGMTAHEIRRRFAFWSAVMALIAGFVSIAGGLVLSAVLVYAVNYYSFGYSLTLAIPWHLPVLLLTVAGFSGYLSGQLQSRSLVKRLSAQSLAQD